MMDPKMGTVEYVSGAGHQVDGAGNCYTTDGVYLVHLAGISLIEISTGRWAGYTWTPVNVIVANE